MNAQTAIQIAFSSNAKKFATLSKMLNNASFKKNQPSTYAFLSDLNRKYVRDGSLSPAQTQALGRTMEKYIPICFNLKDESSADYNTRNSDLLDAEEAEMKRLASADEAPVDESQAH